MPRRKHSVIVDTELDEQAAARRLDRMMTGLFPHAIPESEWRTELEKITAALWRYRDGLDRQALPVSQQVPRVEGWLAERGQLDRVLRHVDAMERAEARWGQPGER